MADLLERLKEALDETERIAREACDNDSGKWFVGSKWNVHRAEDENPFGDDEEHRLVVWGNVSVQSDHIAHFNPAWVLRQVAAHRKILEAWESGERAAAMGGGSPGFGRELFGRQQVLKYILEALAEGYDITVEEPVSPK